MKLSEFKLIKNRQRPDFCYSYEKKSCNKKYTIFTMNGGVPYLASIEEMRIDGRYYTEFSKTCKTVEECLEVFEKESEGDR